MKISKQQTSASTGGGVDIITGGFPCQPYSTAGKRKGTDDERHLWPEMLRAIREIQPTWVVGENVLGLVSWSDGLVFEEVQSDLEAEGYEVQAYVLPAAGVGAPHKRDRVWFVAHSYSSGYRRDTGSGFNSSEEGTDKSKGDKREWVRHAAEGVGKERAVADTSRERTGESTGGINQPWELLQTPGRIKDQQLNKPFSPSRDVTNANECGLERRDGVKEGKLSANRNHWSEFPTKSPVCNGDDGLSSELDAASLFEGTKPRNGKPFGKWRNESIKAGGNAIVPQVVLQIFKAIEQYELLGI